MRKQITRSLLIGLCYALLSSIGYAQELTPKIRSGVLPNQLKYHIVSHPEWGKQRTELRLLLPIGSLVQKDDEAGIAHFIEHMAFGGSKHFPGRSAVRFVERNGGVFGYQINAQTGFDRTIFALSIPSTQQAVDTALMIAKEWVYHLSFEPSVMEEEREIIKQEIKQYVLPDPFQEVKLGIGGHLAKIPIGSVEEVSNIVRESLERFYHQWYRPELCTIVIAGNIDPQHVEDQIKRLFRDKKKGSVPSPIVKDISYPSTPLVKIIDESLSKSHKLEIIYPYNAQKTDPFIVGVVAKFLSQITSGSFTSHKYLGNIHHFVLSVSQSEEAKLLSQAQRALQSMLWVAEYGFPLSPTAIADYCDQRLSYASNLIINQASPMTWAESYTDHVLDGVPIYTDEKGCKKALSEQYSHLSPKMLQSALQQLLQREHGLLMLYQRGVGGALKADELEGILSSPKPTKPDLPEICFSKESTPNQSDNECDDAIFEIKKPSVTPLEVKITEHMGIHIATFANGAKLIMKPIKGQQIILTHIGSGGYNLLPPSCRHLADGADAYVDMGDIGQIPADTWIDMALNRSVTMGSSIAQKCHIIYGKSPKKSLNMLFYALYHKIQSPHVPDAALDADELQRSLDEVNRPSVLTQMITRAPSYPVQQFEQALLTSAQEPRKELTSEELPKITPKLLQECYHTIFSNTKGSNTIVTGAFDPKEVIELYGKTLATIEPKIAQTDENKCSDPIAPIITLPKGTTMITQHHLVWGEYATDWRHSIQLKIIREILRRQLLNTLRIKGGLVYSPQIALNYEEISKGRSRFVLHIENTTSLDESDKVAEIVQKILSKLDQIIKEEKGQFLEIKNILSSNRSVALIDASSWHEALVELVNKGESVEHFDEYDTYLSDITPKSLAQFWSQIKVTQKIFKTEA